MALVYEATSCLLARPYPRYGFRLSSTSERKSCIADGLYSFWLVEDGPFETATPVRRDGPYCHGTSCTLRFAVLPMSQPNRAPYLPSLRAVCRYYPVSWIHTCPAQ